MTVASVEIASAAEFYFDDDYATIIGNKADGMIGFTGYICELYDIESGKLFGYEVKESLAGMLDFNTLWFNLNDISGITNIKHTPKSGSDDAKTYINNSSSLWETKKVSVINASRRFDIELRTQYVFSYDSENDKYIAHKISVPMFFVQEDHIDTVVSDVKSTNNVTIDIEVSNTDISQLIHDYSELLPIFEENKDTISSENVIEYIGDKIIFE